MKDRDEHLEWCKERARKYLDHGRVPDAIASMCSDLEKHPDFVDVSKSMAPLGLLYAIQNDLDGAKRFVEGFR